MRPAQVTDGVSNVNDVCDRDREYLRYPVAMSQADQHHTVISEELDYEVGVINSSVSRNIGDVRSAQLATTQSPSSPTPCGAVSDHTLSRTIADSRAFQTPGLLATNSMNTGFCVSNSGLPFINFGKDRFSVPKHRRVRPEVGFNKYGPVCESR